MIGGFLPSAIYGDVSQFSFGLGGTPSLFAGSAVSQVSASGELSTLISLYGAAQGQPSAQADLDVGNDLRGSAQRSGAAAAALTTAITFGGTTVGISGVSGDLFVKINLSGAALAAAVAAGALNTEITLSADAIAQVLAQAALDKGQSLLEGIAVVEAVATASMTNAVSQVVDPRFEVSQRRRRYEVSA